VILKALSDDAEGGFAKVGKAFDRFIARYAEHVFKDAPAKATERSVARSWKILGQGVLTSLFDLTLLGIMTMLLPLRFFILLIHTPFRLLSERNRSRRNAATELDSEDSSYLQVPQSQRWLPIASVTEHTTVSLKEKR
jgi:hypothetical protein